LGRLREDLSRFLSGGPFVTEPLHAVFLSYASQHADAARRTCESLRAANALVNGGIESSSPSLSNNSAAPVLRGESPARANAQVRVGLAPARPDWDLA